MVNAFKLTVFSGYYSFGGYFVGQLIYLIWRHLFILEDFIGDAVMDDRDGYDIMCCCEEKKLEQ